MQRLSLASKVKTAKIEMDTAARNATLFCHSTAMTGAKKPLSDLPILSRIEYGTCMALILIHWKFEFKTQSIKKTSR